MAVRIIRTLPDPVLRARAVRIRGVPSTLAKLVADMIDTMRSAEGVGLAGNQIGVMQRIAVIEIPDEEEVRVLINPEIIRREGEREVQEGCLSIPGYRGTLSRSESVIARAQDINGRPIRIKAAGLLAQALEHEVDHLRGILYIDRLVSMEHLYKISVMDDDSDESEEREGSAGTES